MVLHIRQKPFSFADQYKVSDIKGRLRYLADGKRLSFAHRLRLCDSEGSELYIVKRRILSLLPCYEIYGNGELFAVCSKRLDAFRPSYLIKSELGSFTIDGDRAGMDFCISRGDEMVGAVHRQLLSLGNQYELYLVKQENVDFLVALAIVLDCGFHSVNA